MGRSRIGGTGMIGQHLVMASLAAGHPTAVLVRPATVADPGNKLKLLEALKASGATIVDGDMFEQQSLVTAFKQADVVISAVGHCCGSHDLEAGQMNIVAAIKEAGNIKRFVPSEYGCDLDQVARNEQAVLEPARSILLSKHRLRQAVRAARIPYTFICSYWAHGFALPRLGDPHVQDAARPPATDATIFGDDNTRVIFVNERDMSTVTLKAVEDPRALNKTVYVRPPANMCSFGHLVHLWERKTGEPLHQYCMPQEELVRKVQESPWPLNFQLAMVHATVAAGVCDHHTVDHAAAAGGVEATELYPDVNFITVDDFLDGLLPPHHIDPPN